MDDDPTASDGLRNRDVARLRDSVKQVGAEDTFGGRFTLIGQAGSGGMGVVYEANDRRDGRRVAIKVITGLPGPGERARFAAEAEVLERLDHPAIVDYVDHGVTRDGEPYIAMEWLVGESLAARLDRGPLSILDTVILGERIADALQHAHAAGVVHRDLKPSNILLVDGKVEEAHLIDFGVAKQAHKDLTHTGQLIGTPGYMAPEQVRGEKSVGASADLFALGCVLYEALTAKAPFEGREVMEVLARLLLETPTPVEQIVEDVPPRLAHLIGALLSKEPEHRVRDAALALTELRAIRAALIAKDTTALDLKPEAIPEPPAPRRARPPVWLIAIAGGGLVVALVTLALVVARKPKPPSDDATRCDATTAAGCQARCDREDATACFFLARDLHKRDQHEAGRVADARACRLGNGDGCFKAAMSAINLAKPLPAGDQRRADWLAEAEKLLVTGCDRGHSECCRELGKQLAKNYGNFAPDPPRSYALVITACEANNAMACNALAQMMVDETNGSTPELRAQARAARAAACTRLADLHCNP